VVLDAVDVRFGKTDPTRATPRHAVIKIGNICRLVVCEAIVAYGVKREDVIKRFGEYSGQLSAQCRTLSAAILVFIWALMTKQDSPAPCGQAQLVHRGLVGIGALVILVLFTDAAQYYAALKVEERCLKKMGRDNDIAMYDQDFWYDLQFRAFHAKFIGFGVAVVWLLGYVLYLLWG
jgi:hypothetical protein